MKFGELEIHLVSDGVVRSDAGGTFGLVPRPLYAPYLQPAPDNTVPMTLTCALIRSEGKTILVDTGLGEKLSPQAQALWSLERPGGGLLESLARLGVAPEDVDLVINTHLHADHCGGNTLRAGDQIVATFPRATYLVQRIEWAEASHPDPRTRSTYLPENFSPLMQQGKLKLLHGDTQVTAHVRCVVTPGHTRAHQAVLLSSGDWRGLWVADMASYAIHMARRAWVTAFDVLPQENIATKARWQAWAVEHDAWLFFEHDPQIAVARLAPEGRRFRLEPIPEAQELTAELPTPEPPRG